MKSKSLIPPPIDTIPEFWSWFGRHEAAFRKTIIGKKRIENDLFRPLSTALAGLHPNVLLLCGETADGNAELVFTADGLIQSIPFIELLVKEAPVIRGWKFTALKEPMPAADFEITMQDYTFSAANISFFPNTNETEPDLIDLTLVYDRYDEKDQDLIASGCYVMLDNYLGELAFTTQVDALQVSGPAESQPELIPLNKLRDYLIWREKEFVEKYDGLRYDTEADEYAAIEARTSDDQPVMAMVNTTLLSWDAHASHPWILEIQFEYDGSENNGLPAPEAFDLMKQIEEQVSMQLPDAEGYLDIARETGQGVRSAWFACKEFRKPALVLWKLSKGEYNGIKLSYDIRKDKYWRSFDQFRVAAED